MSGPLEGIRVVDWSLYMQGPISGYILGDLGADVIKLEPAGTGDVLRRHQETNDGKIVAAERAWAFEAFNRNKKSIALDLRKAEGREVAYRLVKTADVFLHNYSPGTAEKFEMGYETLCRYNPRLIYAEVLGWGSEGPRRLDRAFDSVVMGTAGAFYLAGEPGSPPENLGAGLGDQLGGVMAVLTILAALHARERRGIGQKVNASTLGALLAWEILPLSAMLIGGIKNFHRSSRRTTSNPLTNHYQCADGRWLMVFHMQTDLVWHNWCRALGIEELENDTRFCSHKARAANAAMLISIHDKVFATRTRDRWQEILKENDLISGPIQTLAEAADDPQVLANQYITAYEHPRHGHTRAVGFPYQFSKTPAAITKPPPELGQHSEEVLLEIGYTREEIARLRNERVTM